MDREIILELARKYRLVVPMAREAGFPNWEGTDNPMFVDVIERFANAVCAWQKEQDAKVCIEEGGRFGCCDTHFEMADHLAAAIRGQGVLK